MSSESINYVTRVCTSPDEVDAQAWNRLLDRQAQPTPFMRHEYLAALHHSGSAVPATGWSPHFFTLHQGGTLAAACVAYIKPHSYGEYVFDWAWANAYAQHGLDYYPKAVIAVPFTPVPGTRLLACDASARQALLGVVGDWAQAQGLSSVHLLFASDDDVAASQAHGWMLRHTVQFHWNQGACAGGAPTPAHPSFDAFLGSLTQEKRKKIRQERRKVTEAGVRFHWRRGTDITPQDWDFFYRCYERTYLEHGNAPYLSRAFFQSMADTLPGHWLLFVAEREGRQIASSLIALEGRRDWTNGQFDPFFEPEVAYGRYWGALERVDCLHFEACYYQPLEWCIAQGVQRFEGGAQGEHKMARALLPVKTTSAHWLAHPAFADAVDRFLEREGQGIAHYMADLAQRTPFRRG